MKKKIKSKSSLDTLMVKNNALLNAFKRFSASWDNKIVSPIGSSTTTDSNDHVITTLGSTTVQPNPNTKHQGSQENIRLLKDIKCVQNVQTKEWFKSKKCHVQFLERQ